MGEIVHLGVGVSGSWTSAIEEQIEVVATLTIQKVNRRLGKHFSYRRELVKSSKVISTTNYNRLVYSQAKNTKDNHHIMAITWPLVMKLRLNNRP